jgi:hypothetical protein
MTNIQSDLDIEDILDSPTPPNKNKTHPWRICPIGEHYVRTHVLHVPPSKEHPEGQTVTRHAHCANNPTHKDFLSFDEIQAISKTYFSDLIGPPKSGILTKFPEADEFDQYIRGWVRYWNEVFHATDPLDPNLVKALIASESSFKQKTNIPTSKNGIERARGLMQIIDRTLAILGDHKGEIRDHYINLTHDEIMDPSANICAGVRWLFMKKITAAERLHHKASWDDAVAEYKGRLKNIINGDNPDPYDEMQKFRNFYILLING